MRYIIIFIVAITIVGCTFKGESKVYKYRLDCSKCDFEMEFDDENLNDNIQIKGI